jgi:hypothetical protein
MRVNELRIDQAELDRRLRAEHWLLRSPETLFESFEPHHCKLCEQAVKPVEQRRHYGAHVRRLATIKSRAEAKRVADASARLARYRNGKGQT